jgi:hypothetical protein
VYQFIFILNPGWVKPAAAYYILAAAYWLPHGAHGAAWCHMVPLILRV